MAAPKFEIHMHSTFSDGEFSPTELVGIARKNGVSVLSLTDHDTFSGIPEFVDAAASLVPGCDLSGESYTNSYSAQMKALASVCTKSRIELSTASAYLLPFTYSRDFEISS